MRLLSSLFIATTVLFEPFKCDLASDPPIHFCKSIMLTPEEKRFQDQWIQKAHLLENVPLLLHEQSQMSQLTGKFGCMDLYVMESADYDISQLDFLYQRLVVIVSAKQNDSFDEHEFKNKPTLRLRPVGQDKYMVQAFCGNAEQEQGSSNWIQLSSLLPDIRSQTCAKGLQGRHLQVAYHGLPPYVLHNRRPGTPKGVDNHIVELLADSMQFTFDYVPGKTWGIPTGNGSWTGTTGKVKEGNAEFGLGHLLMVYDRHRVVTFTTPLYPLDLRLIGGKPQPIAAYLNLLKPFPLVIWLFWGAGILGAILVAAGLILFIDKRSISILIYFFGLFFSQGVGSNIYKINSVSYNVLLMTSMGFSFFILAAYECNLRAYIMAKEYEPVADSDQDMVDLGRELWFAYNSIISKQYLHSVNAAKSSLGRLSHENDLFYTVSKGKITPELEEKIYAQKAATPLSELMAAAIFQSQRIYSSKEIVDATYTGFIVPKKAPWIEAVNNRLNLFVDNGFVSYIIEKYELDKGGRSAPRITTQPSPFSPEHFVSSLVILSTGLFVACSVLFMEMNFGQIKAIRAT